jgi:hypothetical protein
MAKKNLAPPKKRSKLSNGQWPLKSVQSVLEATDTNADRLVAVAPVHLAAAVVHDPAPRARTPALTRRPPVAAAAKVDERPIAEAVAPPGGQ